MRENIVWDICAFVPSKAGLTKVVVSHEGGLSKEILLYSSVDVIAFTVYQGFFRGGQGGHFAPPPPPPPP